jgi:hypothetical protein
MKKIPLILVLIILFISKSNAQVWLTENFSIPAGDSISAWGWEPITTNWANTVVGTAPGLTFPGYPLSNIGNCAALTNTGQDYYRNFSVADSSGSIYLSFMINVDTVRTGDYFIGLLPSTSVTAYNLRVLIRNAGGSYYFGLAKGNTVDTIYNGNVLFPLRSTVLVVAKYKFVQGVANDTLSLYAFTSTLPLTEPSTALVGPYGGTGSTDLPNAGRVALRQGTAAQAPYLRIDGIQVSKTWAEIPTGINTSVSIPDKFTLSQNYPNPFNPNTVISYKLSVAGNISLNVYDANGRLIKILESGFKPAGEYSTSFSAEELSSGVYYYSLYADGVLMDTKKAVVMK